MLTCDAGYERCAYLVKYCLAFLRMRGREPACVTAFPPAMRALKSHSYINAVYLDHVFEEPNDRKWS